VCVCFVVVMGRGRAGALLRFTACVRACVGSERVVVAGLHDVPVVQSASDVLGLIATANHWHKPKHVKRPLPMPGACATWVQHCCLPAVA